MTIHVYPTTQSKLNIYNFQHLLNKKNLRSFNSSIVGGFSSIWHGDLSFFSCEVSLTADTAAANTSGLKTIF